MAFWAAFYEKLFNFREIRYFDIQGAHTGLTSKALTAPDGRIRIPLNEEARQGGGQIEEFLLRFNGEGIQHIALATPDIFATVDQLRQRGVKLLSPPPDTYYEMLAERLPGHGQPIEALRRRGILLDGSTQGEPKLLLQIFSECLIGPVFFEFIQRKKDEGAVRIARTRSTATRGAESMNIKRIHHVAYRCNDARETVEFYQRVLGMDYTMAFSEDRVPSTKEPDPYMHVFLDAGMGNVLAFFELPTRAAMGRDPNTPAWVQHIAFEVATLAELLAAKQHVQAQGVEVLGPTDHGLFKSIYFFDPNGHRLELAVNTGTAEQLAAARSVAPAMLEEWSRTKKAPRHAAWLHSKEFTEA
jgi:4-hydroxyphenylpyruvate dioxygenase-like putative hemolysin